MYGTHFCVYCEGFVKAECQPVKNITCPGNNFAN